MFKISANYVYPILICIFFIGGAVIDIDSSSFNNSNIDSCWETANYHVNICNHGKLLGSLVFFMFGLMTIIMYLSNYIYRDYIKRSKE